MPSGTLVGTDLDTRRELISEHIRTVQEADVRRFDEMLAGDFLGTTSDGNLLDRSAFLEHTAHSATIANLKAHDVNVRLLGDDAIIHAHTTCTAPGGRQGASRCTAIWRRRDGR